MVHAESSCTVLYCTIFSEIPMGIQNRSRSFETREFREMVSIRGLVAQLSLLVAQSISYSPPRLFAYHTLPLYLRTKTTAGRASPLFSFCAPVARAWCLDGAGYSFWSLRRHLQILWHCPFMEWVEKPAGGMLGLWETPGHGGRRRALACAQPRRGLRGFGPAVSTLHNLQNSTAWMMGPMGKGSEVRTLAGLQVANHMTSMKPPGCCANCGSSKCPSSIKPKY